MARLDRVSHAKEIAQIGSAIGREFSYEMIQAVSGGADEPLQRSLDELTRSELVLRRGEPPHATYSFEHALVQDAAYSTLLRDKRQRLHARIARVLLDEYVGLVRPEIIAYHCTEGGLFDHAVHFWRDAGDQAARQYANQEAITHYRKGLATLDRLARSEARDEQELGFLTALGPVLMMVMPTGSPDVVRTYARARELASQHQRSRDLFVALWGNWLVSYIGEQPAVARQIVPELYRLAHELKEPGYQLQAHHAEFTMAFHDAKFARTLDLTRASLDLYDEEAHRDHALIYGGHDPGVCASCFNSLALLIMGMPDQAIKGAERSLALADKRSHPPSLAHALRFTADVYHLVRDHEAVLRIADVILALPPDQLSAAGVANAKMLRGLGLIHGGDLKEGSAELRHGLAQWRASGSSTVSPYRLGRAAEALLIAGQREEAANLLQEAIEAQAISGDTWFDAELLRLRGKIRAVAGCWDEAEQRFLESLAAARVQSARWFELRAATNLAQHWAGRGRYDEAYRLLVSPHARFAEGFNTPDMQEAKTALASAQACSTEFENRR
jgi:predicted ATPase